MSKSIVVVGGGAAGMMAAIASAQKGNNVVILEKNEKLGKKIYITGKGRCNLTNACNRDIFFEHICRNPKFMYSSFSAFDNYDLMKLFEAAGCKLVTQRGNRVFPASEKSSDVIATLSKILKNKNIDVRLNTTVNSLNIKDNVCYGTLNPDIKADCVIVATGGLSYASTGSTGDGIQWADSFGLKTISCRPSLVPINTEDDWVKEAQGLSLRNVALKIFDNKKMIFSDTGEMLFTHFGISGPMVLSASAIIGDRLCNKEVLKAYIDLKPALSKEQLDARILRDFSEQKNKFFANSLNKLLPKSLISVIIKLSDIDERTPIHSITVKQRHRLPDLIKALPLNLVSLRGFNEAVVTAGGVCVKEINPKTMESKKIKNLYFVGEVLDVDALTGGFNLQLAFTTGYAAGLACANKCD